MGTGVQGWRGGGAWRRRDVLVGVGCTLGVGAAWAAPGCWGEGGVPRPARLDGVVLLMRHAHAPGTGDPDGFRLDDCATQRNLDEGGRAQARRIGAALRACAWPVGAVWSSQWCRARDTARLAFGAVRDEPAFNSFFGVPAQEPAHTAAALRRLREWSGPGALVVVTHQVNIQALTGVSPASGEAVAVQWRGDALQVLTRWQPG